MQIHHDIESLPTFQNAVVTFGSFDGVHLGHTSIFKKMREVGDEINGDVVVVTFHPHPRLIVYPGDKSITLISTKEEKIDHCKNLGIDHLVFCPFNIEFSQIRADEYIERFIVDKFQPKRIVIGYDHRFGLNRSGNVDFLKAYEDQFGYEVIQLPQKMTEDINISSTRIRNFVTKGKVEMASKLLGHPFRLSGIVIQGHQIGEKLGFPTANVQLSDPHKLVPPEGIYAVQVIYQESRYDGMLYIGTRPTVSNSGTRSIEVNIFDFTEDIYGSHISIDVLFYIREDKEFKNLEGLRKQLIQDEKDAKSLLGSGEKNPSTAVVILNFNGKQHLKTFLPSVLKSTPECEIYVADNNSTDGSLEFVHNHFPEVKTIAMNSNRGFAGGYNEAMAQVEATFIILLNSDVEVTNDWARRLISFMLNQPDAGTIQPKIKSYKNKNTFEYAGAAGGLMDKLGYPFCQGRLLNEVETDLGQYDDAKEIFWTSGAAMMIRKDLFEKVGGFDADFFAHMEEIDLCWRLKQSGYKHYVVPESVVYHLGGGTLSYLSPRKTYLNFRNGMSLLLKNEKGYTLLWLFPIRILLDIIAMIRFALIGELGNARAIPKAYMYIFRHFSSIWSKRKLILETRNRIKVAEDNTSAGRYQGSIVWEFFILGKKKYLDLRHISKSFHD